MDMVIHANSPTVTGASHGVKGASQDSDGTSHAPQEGDDVPAIGVSRGTSHRKKHHKVLATRSPLGYRQRSIARHQSQEHHKVLATRSPLGYRQRSIARHQSQEHLSRNQYQELQE
jgi:hypothetical protein